jgi:putative redox protein
MDVTPAPNVRWITVEHDRGDRFSVDIRDHRLVIDQPIPDGGGDEGPTPTELFVASLASCVAFYARRALHDETLPSGALRVGVGYTMSTDRPARVSTISLVVDLPRGLSAPRIAAVERAVSHCTVHNSIVTAPVIDIAVRPAEVGAQVGRRS